MVWNRNETAKLKEEVKVDSMRACMAEHAMEEAQNREAKYVPNPSPISINANEAILLILNLCLDGVSKL